jgi:hypothetical protein
MTSTAVVLGIATLGTPEAVPDCDCATVAAGIAAISKGIMNVIQILLSIKFGSFLKEYDRTLLDEKNLLFSEALYEKVPRLP